jgi:cation diffusion facilitator CzcD-associated flavoprotein CzcO
MSIIGIQLMHLNSNWHLPKIDGLETFSGVIAHSANYPQDLNLEGKRVAVVGNGSSGIQIVSNIQPHVERLYTWIRSPTWMTPGFAQKWAGRDGGNFKCKSYDTGSSVSALTRFTDSEQQKSVMRNDKEQYLKYRKNVETEMVSGFAVFHRNTPDSEGAREVSLIFSTSQLMAVN